jgi:hypothetical protein
LYKPSNIMCVMTMMALSDDTNEDTKIQMSF